MHTNHSIVCYIVSFIKYPVNITKVNNAFLPFVFLSFKKEYLLMAEVSLVSAFFVSFRIIVNMCTRKEGVSSINRNQSALAKPR